MGIRDKQNTTTDIQKETISFNHDLKDMAPSFEISVKLNIIC